MRIGDRSRLSALLLIAALCLGVAACSRGAESSEEDTGYRDA